jgi:DNA mismatch repair ATPase MutS
MDAGFKSEPLPLKVSDSRQAVANVLENPDSMRILLKQLGTYEVLYRLAAHQDICVVRWTPLTKSGPQLRLSNTYDIRLAPESRVTFSVGLGNERKMHAILTGPNRGGKSTALRAIGRSVFLAHTFGCAVGRSATMTPLRWLQTCLRLEDIPGSKSLFEREVAIASLAKRRLASGPGLLLIDELFHSTNPPDAEIASRRFLGNLWASRNTLSVISTHLFSLAEEDQSSVQRLCCPATENEFGEIKYKYGLTTGICRISSVREILQEQGL